MNAWKYTLQNTPLPAQANGQLILTLIEQKKLLVNKLKTDKAETTPRPTNCTYGTIIRVMGLASSKVSIFLSQQEWNNEINAFSVLL